MRSRAGVTVNYGTLTLGAAIERLVRECIDREGFCCYCGCFPCPDAPDVHEPHRDDCPALIAGGALDIPPGEPAS